MKILTISFSNINNLRGGPHVISFEEAPLSSAGIFAILGPTGSGKSTILDVITLALFNRIPRFKKAISKGEMSGLGSVITHHTNEASAVVQYAINGVKYTSKWEISRTKKGNLKDYEMSLQKADGSYFDLKKSEVPAKNESIIGLQYDQFIKSIILSQGEFSKFLKADKNERGYLLENITGTGIYRKIGKLAYEKYKETKASVELELNKLGEIQILTPEQREAIESSSVEIVKQKKQLDQSIQSLLSLKAAKQELLQASAAVEQKGLEFSTLKQTKGAFQESLEKLRLHEKISPLQADVTNYLAAKNNKIETEKNLKEYKSALAQGQSSLKTVIQEMANLTKEKVKEENFLSKMAQFEKEINLLDNELGHLKSTGTELRNRINSKIESHNLDINQKVSADLVLANLSKQEKQFLTKIKKAGLQADTDISESRKVIKKELEKKEQLKEWSVLLKKKNDLQAQLVQSKKMLVQYKEKLEKNIPLAEKSVEHYNSLQEIDKLQQKQKEDAIKIASLTEHRRALVEGDPCPLCGGLDHPYTAHLPEEKASALETKISKNKAAMVVEEKTLKALKEIITSAETSKKMTLEQSDQFEKESAVLAKELNGLAKQHPSLQLDSYRAIDQLIFQLNEKIGQWEEGLEACTLLKVNKELTENYADLAILGKTYKSTDAKRKEKFTGKDPSEVCNGLQNRFNKHKTSIVENNISIKKETADLKRADNMLLKTSESLEPKVKQLGFASIDAINQHLLSEDELQKIKVQQETLLKSESALKSAIETLQKSQQLAIQKDKQPKLPLETVQSQLQASEQQRDVVNQQIGNNEAQLKKDDELKARRKDKEEIIQGLNKKLERWSVMNKIIGDATGNKFANFAQGLTLQNLLVFTNKRLQKLSDRYLLDQPGEDGSLRIIDQYQGNIHRAVSTLSGGETFLISLALALSLSDMASKNVALESLFIDEGFGTLDQDTLDIALSTLEKLQTESQKTVGVISHVEALKERITVQIKLSKNAQGYSKIEIEGEN